MNELKENCAKEFTDKFLDYVAQIQGLYFLDKFKLKKNELAENRTKPEINSRIKEIIWQIIDKYLEIPIDNNAPFVELDHNTYALSCEEYNFKIRYYSDKNTMHVYRKTEANKDSDFVQEAVGLFYESAYLAAICRNSKIKNNKEEQYDLKTWICMAIQKTLKKRNLNFPELFLGYIKQIAKSCEKSVYQNRLLSDNHKLKKQNKSISHFDENIDIACSDSDAYDELDLEEEISHTQQSDKLYEIALKISFWPRKKAKNENAYEFIKSCRDDKKILFVNFLTGRFCEDHMVSYGLNTQDLNYIRKQVKSSPDIRDFLDGTT